MITFLTVEEVLEIHERQLQRFGGLPGIRDLALLESALAQPRAGFGGDYLHGDLSAMAAAYLFHVVKNHPFLDGNKRTGLIAALTFLAINGGGILPYSPRLYDVTLAAAEGKIGKAEVADVFREMAGS